MVKKWSPILVAIILGGIAIGRIVSTYPVLSPTFDEPAHLAAGMELLSLGTYTYEQQTPPLARLAIAFGPYLAGARSHHDPDLFTEGDHILYATDSYTRTLALARLGNLPFFVLLIAVTGVWGYREFGAGAGVAAILLVSTSPLILAHAALATTDMAAAGTVILCLLFLIEWMERPSNISSAGLGMTAALALTSKLSAALFLPVCAIVLMALRMVMPPIGESQSRLPWRTIQPRYLLLGAITFVGSIWTIYGFISNPATPALNLWQGFKELRWHNEQGHPAYFLGEVRWNGWWYFFPLALLLKTPLPLLLMWVCGGLFLKRITSNWRHWAPLACAGTILACVTFSRINIGTRHVLAVYAILCMIGGLAVVRLWQSTKWPNVTRTLALVAVIWQLAISAAAHPDYLSYFNPLAGTEPGRLMADSDLDWGQDINRLAAFLRAYHVRHVWVSLHTSTDLRQYGLPVYESLPAYKAVTGWIAISWTKFDLGCAQPPFNWYCWLDNYRPIASIGDSIRLYRISNVKDFSSRFMD